MWYLISIELTPADDTTIQLHQTKKIYSVSILINTDECDIKHTNIPTTHASADSILLYSDIIHMHQRKGEILAALE